MDPDASHSLHTRPTLLFKLRDWEDAESWAEFYRLYRKLVFGLARRSGLSSEEAEEVTQDVFKRVSETIHEFESNPARGSFRGWLMNLTRWRVRDKFRERKRSTPQGPYSADSARGLDTVEQIPDTRDVDAEWDAEWQEYIIAAALTRIAKRVPGKHFQAFELYTRQHWPALKVASELGLNPASVYLISHRLTKQLKTEVMALQATLA